VHYPRRQHRLMETAVRCGSVKDYFRLTRNHELPHEIMDGLGKNKLIIRDSERMHSSTISDKYVLFKCQFLFSPHIKAR